MAGRSTMNARRIIHDLVAGYLVAGKSLPTLAKEFSLPISSIRTALVEARIELRTREDAMRSAVSCRPSPAKGRPRPPFSEQWKQNISTSRLAWAEANAVGVSVKKTGRVVLTRGENKDRLLHDAIMESRLGRRMLPDECVHHIDGNPSNNDENNLALMTRSGHMRLHRLQDAISGKIRERLPNGRFR